MKTRSCAIDVAVLTGLGINAFHNTIIYYDKQWHTSLINNHMAQ